MEGRAVRNLEASGAAPWLPPDAPPRSSLRGGASSLSSPSRRPTMPDSSNPATARAAPAMHPMEPRRGENLSPRFAAVLAWLFQLPPMTTPAITGILVSGDCVFAATDTHPFHDTLIGDIHDLQRNLRDWGTVCGAHDEAIDSLIARLRSAGQ